MVCMMYGPANWDPNVLVDPDNFRVDRKPHHLAFGVGPHFCLGASLARMALRVIFEEVLRRLPDMEYSRGGPDFTPSALVRACSSMWVQYSPETETKRAPTGDARMEDPPPPVCPVHR